MYPERTGGGWEHRNVRLFTVAGGSIAIRRSRSSFAVASIFVRPGRYGAIVTLNTHGNHAFEYQKLVGIGVA